MGLVWLSVALYNEPVNPALAHDLLLPYWFAVGACIGSFLNVVIFRLPAGLSIVTPRSHCPRCKHPIAWYDNLPLLSWLILRARCRHCGARIAVRYFLVELLMAGLTAALWMRFSWSWDFAVWLPLFAALLAIAFLDIDEWWVPDVITYPAAAWAFAASFIPGGLRPQEALLGLGPAVLALAVAWGFQKIARKEGLGFGDIKLLGVLGLAVGLVPGLAVLILAALQGAVVGLVVVLTGGHRPSTPNAAPSDPPATEPRDNEAPAAAEPPHDDEEWTPPPHAFPFGPFLVLAAFEVVLLPQLFANLPTRFALLFWERLL